MENEIQPQKTLNPTAQRARPHANADVSQETSLHALLRVVATTDKINLQAYHNQKLEQVRSLWTWILAHLPASMPTRLDASAVGVKFTHS